MSIHLNIWQAANIFVNNGLLAHELLHLLIATPLAAYLIYKRADFKYIFLLYAVTILIDIDHLFDYFLFSGLNFDLADFLGLDYFGFGGQIQWALVPLHGWEWFAIMTVLAARNKWKLDYQSVLFGYTAHMILDTINVGSFIYYFVSYRVLYIANLLHSI